MTLESVVCPDCQGLKFIRQDLPYTHPDFGKLKPCPNEIHGDERQKILLAQSGLAYNEYWLLDDLVRVEDTTYEMIELMRSFMAKPRGWVYLWGGFGVGKSVALQAAVYETILTGRPAYYTTLADLLGVVKDAFNPPKNQAENTDAWRNWDTAESRLKRLCDVFLLALDEFDPEHINETDFVRELNSRLIGARYRGAVNEQSVTLFAANRPPTAHRGWIADRFEDGRFTVFENTGRSVRPQMSWTDEI